MTSLQDICSLQDVCLKIENFGVSLTGLRFKEAAPHPLVRAFRNNQWLGYVGFLILIPFLFSLLVSVGVLLFNGIQPPKGKINWVGLTYTARILVRRSSADHGINDSSRCLASIGRWAPGVVPDVDLNSSELTRLRATYSLYERVSATQNWL